MQKKNMVVFVLCIVFLIIFSFSLRADITAHPNLSVIELCNYVFDHYEYTYHTYYTNNSYKVCRGIPAWNISKVVCDTKEFIEKNNTYSCCNNHAYQLIHKEINETKPIYRCRRIGVNVNGKVYKGWVNVEGNILSIWSVPIGDGNFKEHGRCRRYEIRKGFCEEIDLLKTKI